MDPTSLVATLVTDPARPILTPALAAKARTVSGAAEAVWLDEGVACDLMVPGQDAKAAEDEIRAALGGEPVDVVVQPHASRRKSLFLADMDSTMIEQECIDELADFVGLKAEVSGITERAMRGEIAFEPALRERVALLKGLPVAIVDRIMSERITFTPGGRALVATMAARGGYACLVSGGFTLFTGPVASRLGFAENRANILLVQGDSLAGLVAEPILGREAKRDALIELRAARSCPAEAVMAVGDGANDLAMLAEAGLGVAFRAKPAVAAAAHARIDHADLSALLYLQGYRRADFAAG